MDKDLMYQCEQKKPHLILDENKKPTGKRGLKWVAVDVSSLPMVGTEIRCVHCHGAIKLHKQKRATGPVGHVEHRDREDSERCQGGIHFTGPDHQMSLNPIP